MKKGVTASKGIIRVRVSQQQKVKTSKTQKEITGNTGSNQRKGILDPVPVWFGS